MLYFIVEVGYNALFSIKPLQCQKSYTFKKETKCNECNLKVGIKNALVLLLVNTILFNNFNS